LARLKAELEKQSAERKRSESRWVEQLDAAKAQKNELEKTWAAALERNIHFEELLTGLRKERDELNGKLKAEQQAAEESKRLADDLQTRLGRNSVEFETARTELEKRNAARERVESEWSQRLQTAKALTQKLETAWAGAVERNRRLEGELAGLQQERDELTGKLAGELSAAAGSKKRAEELAIRLDQQAAELERCKAMLEKQNSEPGNPEANPRKHADRDKPPTEKVTGPAAGPPPRHEILKEQLGPAPRPSSKLYDLKP